MGIWLLPTGLRLQSCICQAVYLVISVFSYHFVPNLAE